jgi:tRNA(adenine34) deaminase
VISQTWPVPYEADERLQERFRPWMTRALKEADDAELHGDVPVGAVIVDEHDQVLVTGHNRREIDGDPTAHAEIVAMRQAAAHRGHWRLDGLTMIVTLEPCVMCAGALVNSRVTRLVYGTDDPKAGAVRSVFELATHARLNHRLEVIFGVMAVESAERLRAFFAKLRRDGQKLRDQQNFSATSPGSQRTCPKRKEIIMFYPHSTPLWTIFDSRNRQVVPMRLRNDYVDSVPTNSLAG